MNTSDSVDSDMVGSHKCISVSIVAGVLLLLDGACCTVGRIGWRKIPCLVHKQAFGGISRTWQIDSTTPSPRINDKSEDCAEDISIDCVGPERLCLGLVALVVRQMQRRGSSLGSPIATTVWCCNLGPACLTDIDDKDNVQYWQQSSSLRARADVRSRRLASTDMLVLVRNWAHRLTTFSRDPGIILAQHPSHVPACNFSRMPAEILLPISLRCPLWDPTVRCSPKNTIDIRKSCCLFWRVDGQRRAYRSHDTPQSLSSFDGNPRAAYGRTLSQRL